MYNTYKHMKIIYQNHRNPAKSVLTQYKTAPKTHPTSSYFVYIKSKDFVYYLFEVDI